jgi:hypothetical protein
MSIFGNHDTGNARDSDVLLLVMGIEMGMGMQMPCSMLRLMLPQEPKLERRLTPGMSGL